MEQNNPAWLEREYQDFERQFFFRARFWRAPAQALKGTHLYPVFEEFARLFPEHPLEINTVFYLVESLNSTPATHHVWFWCGDFEHYSVRDLRNLAKFMEDAALAISRGGGEPRVETLDRLRKRILLMFFDPQQGTVELLKTRGVPGGLHGDNIQVQ
jgi:hypothetical protein